MEVILEGLVRDKLIDQHPLRAGNAVSDERNEVAVVHPADDIDLGLKLSLTLTAPRLELLHCNLLSVRQHPFVYVTEPSLAQEVRLREAAGR